MTPPDPGREATYPPGVTLAEHIAHDMRKGRFPEKSSIADFLAERAASFADTSRVAVERLIESIDAPWWTTSQGQEIVATIRALLARAETAEYVMTTMHAAYKAAIASLGEAIWSGPDAGPIDRAIDAVAPRQFAAGDTLVWAQRGVIQTGVVEADPTYEGGLRVGGRSLAALREEADDLRIVPA